MEVEQTRLTITRRLEFDYGHRVLGHEGKCAAVHGHRGVAEITVSAPQLDGIGRVIDFSKVKEEVGGWVDDFWDHNILLNQEDPLLPHLQATESKIPYVMPEGNPTAENMARLLSGIAYTLLKPYGIRVDHVRVYETPNCWADYSSTPAHPQPSR